jgi:hypothetical protein
MIRFLMEAGPFIWPVILLTLVIGLLFLWNAVILLVRPSISSGRRKSINAVLFWGGVAAVLGLLGQWLGIHRMASIVAERGIVSPQAVALGISESLLTPLAGMFVLVGSAVLWSLLRLGLWSAGRKTSGG